MVTDFVRIIIFASAMVLAFGYGQNFYLEDEPFLKKLYFTVMILLFVGAGAISII